MLSSFSYRSEYENDLRRRAAEWPADATLEDLGLERLQQIAADEGIDFATALLYDRVVASQRHGPFIAAIDLATRLGEGDADASVTPAERCPASGVAGRLLDCPFDSRPATPLAGRTSHDGDPVQQCTVVIVPGAFYREFPHTGADGRLVREQAETLGWRCEMIPLSTMGTLAENAAVICDWLAQCPYENIILVSISKGGSDIKKALGQPHAPAAFHRVVAWVNLCGILTGSPLVEWLLSSRWKNQMHRLIFAMRGFRTEFLYELARRRGGPRDFPLQLPPQIQMINLIGFPLTHHLHNRLARNCHQRLAAWGPNDGNVILADACSYPGSVYPVWGADHYLQPRRDMRQLLAATLRYVAVERDRPNQHPHPDSLLYTTRERESEKPVSRAGEGVAGIARP